LRAQLKAAKKVAALKKKLANADEEDRKKSRNNLQKPKKHYPELAQKSSELLIELKILKNQ